MRKITYFSPEPDPYKLRYIDILKDIRMELLLNLELMLFLGLTSLVWAGAALSWYVL